jgi:uncharacterized membrane protein YjjB (DUF3815 family)
MDLSAILMNSIWAALFAAGLSVLLTAPMQHLGPAFMCGFTARFARDLCMSFGLSVNWATVIAAALVVLVAVAIIRRHTISPVVLICGVLPLGAAVAMFNLIFALMQVSSANGDAAAGAATALSANAGKVFTISLAIAVGLGAGVLIVRFFNREETDAV